MLTEAELQKKWESLTFTDDFIFSRVMHDENICRQVVATDRPRLSVRVTVVRFPVATVFRYSSWCTSAAAASNAPKSAEARSVGHDNIKKDWLLAE